MRFFPNANLQFKQCTPISKSLSDGISQKEKILYEIKHSYNLLHIYSVIHTIQLYILFSYTHYFTRYTQVFLGMFYIANIHGAGECELDIEYFVVFVRTSGLPE